MISLSPVPNGFLITLLCDTPNTGHGNMTPRTAEGKLVTMVYALFGVPLMLMCLSSLGGLLAEALQCAYCRVCQRRTRRNGLQLQESGDKIALTNGCATKQKRSSLSTDPGDSVRSYDEVSLCFLKVYVTSTNLMVQVPVLACPWGTYIAVI